MFCIDLNTEVNLIKFLSYNIRLSCFVNYGSIPNPQPLPPDKPTWRQTEKVFVNDCFIIILWGLTTVLSEIYNSFLDGIII